MELRPDEGVRWSGRTLNFFATGYSGFSQDGSGLRPDGGRFSSGRKWKELRTNGDTASMSMPANPVRTGTG